MEFMTTSANESSGCEELRQCGHRGDVALAQQGNAEALDRLMRDTEPRLFRFLLLLLRNSEDARDVTQDALVRVVAGLPRYRPTGLFLAWAIRIARNEAMSFLHKSRRSQEVLSAYHAGHSHDAEQFATRDSEAHQSLVEDEELRRLIDALQYLDAADREVVVLRDSQGLKFREIAELTETPLNTVLARMRRATHLLKERLKDHFHPLHAANADLSLGDRTDDE